jgi:hypothetical protein
LNPCLVAANWRSPPSEKNGKAESRARQSSHPNVPPLFLLLGEKVRMRASFPILTLPLQPAGKLKLVLTLALT